MLKLAAFPLIILLLAGCSDSESGSVKAPGGEGESWLAVNAGKEGVVVTESGLQYRVLHTGDGLSPGLTDKVVTHYVGSFVDGRVFDSSVERGQPAEFPVNGVIKGWTEALQLMKEGDKWQLTIPPELGYGAKGTGPIPGNTVLVFEVELLKVKAR
jgi:FKBP-type peptidyl-prolyl cis-trans isomerase FklB